MSQSGVTLAIETSQRTASIALRDPSGRMRLHPLRTVDRHEDDLMPSIDQILRSARLRPADLETVAVSIGPGGFTGLRIAVTTARMLAETLNLRLVGIPSALVAAASTPQATLPVLVALASKGDRAWCSVVMHSKDGPWRFQGDVGLRSASQVDWTGTAAALLDRFAPAAFFEEAKRAGVATLEPLFSAAACLHLAEQQAGEAVEAHDLAPIYARPPDLITRAGRRNQLPFGRTVAPSDTHHASGGMTVPPVGVAQGGKDEQSAECREP